MGRTLREPYRLSMAWTTTTDAHEFLAAAGALLRASAASNTVLLSVAENVAVRGPNTFGDEPPLFGWWARAGGSVAAAIVHTPPYPAQLSAGFPHVAVDALADLLAGRGRRLAGVGGAESAAWAFAAAWCIRCDALAKLALALRLYRLAALHQPEPAPPGLAQVATVADRALVRDWIDAFARETGALTGGPRTLDERLAAGSLTIWRDGRGTAVALAGCSREIAGARRVGPVYTDPGHRRRGYGAAVTAAACRRALDGGTSELLLYADRDNPTSNALYLRLGFEHLEDRTTLRFVPRA